MELRASSVTLGFGAFVDIGVHEDGLIHIQALHIIRQAPFRYCKVGDIVKVKVLSVICKRHLLIVKKNPTSPAIICSRIPVRVT